MKSIIKSFFKDESGATAIEYGLIAAGIAIAIITVVNGLGTKLSTNFRYHQQLTEVTAHFGGILGTGRAKRPVSFVLGQRYCGEISTFYPQPAGALPTRYAQ